MGRRRRKAKRGLKLLKAAPEILLYAVVFGCAGLAVWHFLTSPAPRTHPQEAEEAVRQAPRFYVGIVDQLYSLSLSFTDEAVRLLESRGVSVNVHRDEEVTVELYRRLPSYGYRLIILRVHAAVDFNSTGHPVFMFSSEPYSQGKYFSEQMEEQIACGALPYMGNRTFFIVGPKFVERSMEGGFNGSVVVLSSCSGLHSLSLAKALVGRGVGVFISWDASVSLDHADKATLELIKALILDRLPVSEAVKRVMSTVGRDPDSNSMLKYYPANMGFIILTGEE